MAKRHNKAQDQPDSRGGSVVLFTALMIILLAFFILLNSVAVIDEERKLLALGSLLGSFGILPAGLSPIKTEGHSLLPPSSPMQEAGDATELVREFLKGCDLTQEVSVGGGALRKVVTIQSAFLFEPGSYELNPEAFPLLASLARYLNLNDFPVRIEGHTDDAPQLPAGVSSDWELSGLRSLAVLHHLVQTGKVSPHRLSAFGYGRHRPVAPNNSPLNRARNRRVCLVLDAREKAAKDELEDRSSKPAVFDFKGFLFKIFRRP
jgi:chemotaxis protein MotB